MTAWLLLLDPPLPGPRNMARDQALLDLAQSEGTAVLRLYQWQPHSLSFGRHEPALRRYDRERIEREGIACVRRPTGGRAVWHARELTYSVTAPVSRFGSLALAYRRIHLALASAIRALGLAPTLAAAPSRAAGVGTGACFATSAGGEVMVEGAKVIGSAQLRQGNGFLQHGSMLLQDDQDLVRQVTRGTAPDSRGMPLVRLLDVPLEVSRLAEAVAAGFETEIGPLTPWDGAGLDPAASAHEPRFASPEWTWHR